MNTIETIHHVRDIDPDYPACTVLLKGRHDGITASNISPVAVFSILQSNRRCYHIYTVTIVIHKSRNLIGTEELLSLGLNRARFFSE